MSKIRELGQNALPRSCFFLSLHNQDAELKGNKLMLQRKWNLHVKDSRSSEERDQENLDIKTTVRWSESPQPQGIYLAEGNGESAPQLA